MQENKRIVLIVEDEHHIADLLVLNLKLEGYLPIHVDMGSEAIKTVNNQKVDLVILDVMLPDHSGIDVCRKLKRIRPALPVLMLSALGQSSDRIKGLKSGADDYLAKPFNLEELLLRIEKLLIRHNATSSSDHRSPIRIGEAILDLEKMVISFKGEAHILTTRESDLLAYMVERRNKVLSRQEILENVWGYEVYPNTRTIDNFVSSFRKYVGDDVAEPSHFITIRGVGYMLSL